MKLLVTTRADENIEEMSKLTHPIFKEFCDRWKADFMVFDHESECKEGARRNHYRITKIRELLDKYDRVISFDTDIIINKTCPNLFEEVPYDCIGTVLEDKGTRILARRRRIYEIQRKFGEVNWYKGYINTGVFVVSKIHKDIFNPIADVFWMGEGEDDVHIGYNIHKMGMKIHELQYIWNHMTMFSEPWNNSANRFDSYIIHYAGQGKFDQKDRNTQIRMDKEKIWGTS